MDKKMLKNLILIAISMLAAVHTSNIIRELISFEVSPGAIKLLLRDIFFYGQNIFILRVLYLAFVKEKAMSKQWMIVGLVLMLFYVLFSSVITYKGVIGFKNAVMIISIVFVLERYIRNKPIHVGNFMFTMLLLALVYVELQIISQQVQGLQMINAVNLARLIKSINPLILMIIIVAYINGNKKICTYTVATFTISVVTSAILMFIFAELFFRRLINIPSILVYIPYILLASGILMLWRQDDRL